MSDNTAKYAYRLMFFVLAITALVFVYKFASFEHPMPAADCTHPYDYPICTRAVAPVPFQPPSNTQVGMIITGLLMLFFIYASYKASVTKQKDTLIEPHPQNTPPAIPNNVMEENNG